MDALRVPVDDAVSVSVEVAVVVAEVVAVRVGVVLVVAVVVPEDVAVRVAVLVALLVGVVTSAQLLNRAVVPTAPVVVGVEVGVLLCALSHAVVPLPEVAACHPGAHSRPPSLTPQ